MSAVAALRAGARPPTPLAAGLQLYAAALLAGMGITVAATVAAMIDPTLWAWTDRLLWVVYPVQDVLMTVALLRVASGVDGARRALAGVAAAVSAMALMIDLVGATSGGSDLTYVAAGLLQTVAVIVLLSVLRMSAARAGQRSLATWCTALQLCMVPATAGLLAASEQVSLAGWAVIAAVSVIPWLGVALLCLRAAPALPSRRSR